ncbi:hypothetical protein [Anaerotignum propionicum]|uniref:Uncharacterized protein n=1 Tax=Anaerotignum propionicum DSM 1682 TaxID=991789 RepID=A0A0X1U6X2_ANAPI|nr:hypothetical protein [Anaerotignum propionicum]AMJ40697.1 hypothetical protein CPRO_11020 [Anaerotignum propionicum DSM 1682]SHE89917.1 hypothetical protein SAMN02745151_02127 [[Clostridium] propionicum DSM 1682] [Anaerotignum propionicum DSM 1682]
MMVLNELVGILRPLGYPVKPFGTTEIEDCIVYNFIPLTSDKIKEQNRLEVTVISKSMEKGLKILEDVKNLLITQGDEQLTDSILNVALNGGGSLENLETNTFHFKANFIVLSRYRRA